MTCRVNILLVLTALEMAALIVGKVQLTNQTTVITIQTPAVGEHPTERNNKD